MVDVHKILAELLDADNQLAAAYTKASQAARIQIEACRRAINQVADRLVIWDIRSRTEALKQLKANLDSARKELETIKQTVNQVSAAGKAINQALGILMQLLPLL